MKRYLTLAALMLTLIAVAAGCAGDRSGESGAESVSSPPAWVDMELRDALTGETFRVSDFRGTPVFVESFAVWCPTCSRQLHEMKEVLQSSDAVLVALDTDPNEDEARVREHVRRNGFAGRFAVAPPELTELLLDEFGPEIVAVPTAPVILVSADQTSARLLDRGVKSASELLQVVEEAR